MEKNNQLYFQSAKDLHLPATYLLNDISCFVIALGKQKYFFYGAHTPFNKGSNIWIAKNKYSMNKILKTAGFPVPKAILLSRYIFQETDWHVSDDFQSLKFPLVVKPASNTSSGQDVICNIKNKEILHAYLQELFIKYPHLSIEEFHGGLRAYRVLVFFNKVIGVVERIPAHVVGDGHHTIAELMALTNEKRATYSNKIFLASLKEDDPEYRIRLDELGLTFASIPAAGEEISLGYTCNASRGGTMISLDQQICQENKKLFCRAANTLGLDIVGFDLLCEDINLPMEKSQGVIIEATHTPDIVIHELPVGGKSTRVSKTILKKLIKQHLLFYFFKIFLKNTSRNSVFFRFLIVAFIFFLLVWLVPFKAI